MTNAITQGFQIGVGLMQKPFQYFVSALSERIKDEQSDIKAAGGYFSISMRQQKPFVKTFAEAMQFTQENNKYMAILAGALPGNTQTYIEVGKRISDSVSRVVMSNTETARAYANQLRADPNRTGGVAAAITDTGAKGARQTITELLGTLTKKTVLAGLGGGGAGGVAGAYGLPGLSERLLTQQDVTMGQFRRYAAIFRDPLISDALERYIPKINATSATTIERFKTVDKMFDEVLPPEMIRAYERSTSGILEAYNTLFLGPETGFLGLGRKLKGLGKKMDDFGRYVDADGVVTNFAGAVEAELSIFDMLKDVFANFGISLFPIIEFLPTLFDPLVNIGKTLVDLRHYSGKFLSNFDAYKNGLMDYAKSLEKGGNKLQAEKILSNVSLRATLATINNAFRSAGIFDMAAFTKNAKKIMAADFDAGAMVKSFMETFMTSDAAKVLGTQIGTTVKTVLIFVSSVLDQLIGVAQAGKLVSGLKEGFGEEGKAAVSNIIRKVFQGIAKALYTVFQAAPLEFTLAGIATLGLPALMGGLSTALGSRIQMFMDEGLPKLFSKVGDILAKISPKSIAALLKAKVSGFFSGLFAVFRIGAMPGGFIGVLLRMGQQLAKVGPRFTSFFQGFLGKLSIFGAIVTSIVSLLQGKDLATSLAQGAGPLIGSAIGFALAGPLGAFIGGWLGSQEIVTQPLRMAFDGVIQSISPLLGLLGQILSDIEGLARAIPGVGEGFNLIQFALFALLSPFKMLQIGILGLYQLYLETKRRFLGLDDGEKDQYNKNEKALKKAENEFIVDGKRALGKSLAQIKAEEYNTWKEARKKGDTDAMNASARFMMVVEEKIKSSGAASKPPVKDPLTDSGKGIPTLTAIDKNTGREIVESKEANRKASETQKNTRTSAKSLDNLVAKISKMDTQTAVQGILSLLSSGNLRVKTSVSINNPFGTPPTPDGSKPPKPRPKSFLDLSDPKQVVIDRRNGIAALRRERGMIGQTEAAALYDKGVRAKGSYKGSLGDAVSSEMKNKPSGSSLVIANSSETIIPAAGGLGMSDFMKTLHTGFYTLTNHFKALGKGLNNLDTKTKGSFDKVDKKVSENKTQTQTNMSKMAQSIASLTQKVGEMNSASMMMGGGYGSGGVRIAGMLGNFIKMTGGAPGSIHEHPWFGGVRGGHSPGSYHYSGRAIDIGAYANEQAGVISRIMAFNRKMGVKPVEFLHAGNRADHQDHVHVAYAYGPGNGLSFNSADAANRWEKSKVGSATVKTFTTNSREMAFGGGATINAPISIYQQPGQDPEELAAIVVARLSMAVESLSNYV
jgi:hypothetical protein